MTVKKKIQEAAATLETCKKPLTPTFLMWEVLNITSDKELYELDSDIVDVAEKVEYFLTGVER